jgi:DNA-binding PadR family transcriptional regulator
MTNESLSQWDLALLEVLARVRGIRPETVLKYSKLKIPGGSEAIRKRLDRLCDKGLLAKSSLPRGGQIYRLSHKGVRLTGASAAFANSPSVSIAAEMLSISSVAWKTSDYLFPTNVERDSFLAELAENSSMAKVHARLFLRLNKTQDRRDNSAQETCIHYWLAELRPPNDLQKRTEIIVQNLLRIGIFLELNHVGLFGITIAVPSHGVKASLDASSFPVSTETLVVEELQNLFT